MADKPITEEWRVVEDAPSYEVSNTGKVRRAVASYAAHPITGTMSVQFPAGREHRLSPDASGYLCVTLRVDGRYKRFFVAVLVCKAFHGARPGARHQAAHGDGCSTNNLWTNLRWATPKENVADATKHEVTQQSKRLPPAKLRPSEVLEIRRRIKEGKETTRQLAIAFKVAGSTIKEIKLRKTWKHLYEPL